MAVEKNVNKEMTKTYRTRLYFLIEKKKDPILIYGFIFPWEVHPSFYNKVTETNCVKKFYDTNTRIIKIDFASNEEFSKLFFYEIKNKPFAEFSELDFSRIKSKTILDWKFNSSTLFFHNIFLEQDLADNVLRENNSWQNILTFGSAIADIYLEIDKSHFFEKGFDFLLELNNFFQEKNYWIRIN